ncbi:hypothetical protein COOONC_03024 [Cooperia oncophora]
MRNIVFFWIAVVVAAFAIDTLQTTARKGQLFVYTLHSASFFSATVDDRMKLICLNKMQALVDVKWSATLRNRPALPSWLHLVPSRHKALAYLVGMIC